MALAAHMKVHAKQIEDEANITLEVLASPTTPGTKSKRAAAQK